MKVSTSAILLAALAVGEATASQKHNHAARHSEMMQAINEKRDIAHRDLNILSATAGNLLKTLGLTALGVNAVASNGLLPWLGPGGQYTNTFHNEAANELQLVVWGVAGSWVNAVQPHITVSIPAGGSQLVSFPSGASGAWSVADASTKLVNGQIFNTWGEFTFGPYGVVDVSREVNMHGINMTIVGPKCVSTMDICSFHCKDGEVSCWDKYELVNCANGSQEGATFGQYNGTDSGGCGGMGDTAALNTYLNSRT